MGLTKFAARGGETILISSDSHIEPMINRYEEKVADLKKVDKELYNLITLVSDSQNKTAKELKKQLNKHDEALIDHSLDLINIYKGLDHIIDHNSDMYEAIRKNVESIKETNERLAKAIIVLGTILVFTLILLGYVIYNLTVF